MERDRLDIRLDEYTPGLLGEQHCGGVVRKHELAVEQDRILLDETIGGQDNRAIRAPFGTDHD